MNREYLWNEVNTLPQEAQQQVLDFIAFLRWRYAQSYEEIKERVTELPDEPFVGMWRDRQDMSDSSKWVRQVRIEEWS
jgi:hypothetical protein